MHQPSGGAGEDDTLGIASANFQYGGLPVTGRGVAGGYGRSAGLASVPGGRGSRDHRQLPGRRSRPEDGPPARAMAGSRTPRWRAAHQPYPRTSSADGGNANTAAPETPLTRMPPPGGPRAAAH